MSGREGTGEPRSPHHTSREAQHAGTSTLLMHGPPAPPTPETNLHDIDGRKKGCKTRLTMQGTLRDQSYKHVHIKRWGYSHKYKSCATIDDILSTKAHLLNVYHVYGDWCESLIFRYNVPSRTIGIRNEAIFFKLNCFQTLALTARGLTLDVRI